MSLAAFLGGVTPLVTPPKTEEHVQERNGLRALGAFGEGGGGERDRELLVTVVQPGNFVGFVVRLQFSSERYKSAL